MIGTSTGNTRRRRVGRLTDRRVSVQLGQDLYDRAETEAERLGVSTSLLLRHGDPVRHGYGGAAFGTRRMSGPPAEPAA